jgi:hypothetical protein
LTAFVAGLLLAVTGSCRSHRISERRPAIMAQVEGSINLEQTIEA